MLNSFSSFTFCFFRSSRGQFLCAISPAWLSANQFSSIPLHFWLTQTKTQQYYSPFISLNVFSQTKYFCSCRAVFRYEFFFLHSLSSFIQLKTHILPHSNIILHHRETLLCSILSKIEKLRVFRVIKLKLFFVCSTVYVVLITELKGKCRIYFHLQICNMKYIEYLQYHSTKEINW